MILAIRNIFKKNTDVPPSSGRFPEKGISSLQTYSMVSSIAKGLKNRKTDGIGDLYNLPNKTAISVWQKLIQYNPGYLGLMGASNEEKNSISMMIDLYNGKWKEINGYITSGATEGNIYSCWTGRKFLEQSVKKEHICLLRTDLTHFSVRKAADIVGIPEYIVGINEIRWNMSISSLESLIYELYKKGYRGFIIPFTLGYTVGGTNDDIEKIEKTLRLIEGKLKVHFFTWIDAALSGLTYPFLKKDFSPFKNQLVKTIVVDFHKFAGVPYPAGMILYRNSLIRLTKNEIPYLKEKDDTLLGSRSGIPAIAILATIKQYGQNGFRKIVIDCLKRKNQFMLQVKKQFPNVVFKTDPKSINLAMISKYKLPKPFCEKFGLLPINYKIKFEIETKTLNIYKIFFLPVFDK